MARITINAERQLSEVSPFIFGHFMEHAFGNIYGGVYAPGNPLSDENGHRKDVIEALKRVKVPILRYPGGNFVSNYHWENGVGPKESRKKVFEYAWNTVESNQYGTSEFIELCRELGAEPLICVNMGTGSAEEAMHWVEYCNRIDDSVYANLRRSHGHDEPFRVRYWGLGNEMYGNHQMGALTAEEYARKAVDFARAMKFADPSIQLIICGFDTDWNLPAVQSLMYYADYISVHSYPTGWFDYDRGDNDLIMSISNRYQAINDLVVANIYSAANNSLSRMKVTWDEWNLFGWQVKGVDDDETYTLQNAIYTASVLNFFIRNSSTVKMAHYSTFVNINGAISVKPDGILYRPQFYVFEMLANNVGTKQIDCFVQSDSYDFDFCNWPDKLMGLLGRTPPVGLGVMPANKELWQKIQKIPYVDAVATCDADYIYISVVNKNPDMDVPVEFDLTGRTVFPEGSSAQTLFDEDLYAYNAKGLENRVKARMVGRFSPANRFTMVVRKHSANVLRLRTRS